MTTENNQDCNLQNEGSEERINNAIQRIGRAIEVRRKTLGLRQSDLSDKTGIGTTKISKIESGTSNYYLTTALNILDKLGLLDNMLDALPSSDSPVPGRVSQADRGNASAALYSKLMTVSQFELLSGHDSTVIAPVSAPSAVFLRKKGFATRPIKHDELGNCFLAASVDHVRYDENVWDTAASAVGGFKQVSVTVALSQLSEKRADVAPMMCEAIRQHLNQRLERFTVYVRELIVSDSDSSHIVELNGQPIDSVYIYEKICESVDHGEWI